jgi:Ni/Fe-hydrogenase subunit HybB-like protein
MIGTRINRRSILLAPRAIVRLLRREFERTPTALKAWYAGLGVLMIIGAAGAVRALFPGDKGIGTTPTVEWGMLIVGYVFFAITTSGLCLASSLGTVFGIDRFRPLEKRHAVLAVLCLVTAFGIIALDLHYPVRMVLGAAFNPSPTSPMWWMGFFYAIYLCCLLVELWSIFWRHARIHQWACLASSIMAVLAPATLGAVFGVLASRAYWSGIFTPILMVSSAFVAGTGLLAIAFYGVSRLRLAGWVRGRSVAVPSIRLLLTVGLLVAGVLIARELYVGLNSTDSGLRHATETLVSGPFAAEFIGLRLVGGLLVPLTIVLLPWTRTPAWLLIAGVLSIGGVFVDRLTFVEAGQVAPVTTISGVVSAPYAAYSPSLVEISILVGAVALVAFMYTLAERYLDLGESEIHVFVWLPNGVRDWLRRRAQPVPVAAVTAVPAGPAEAPSRGQILAPLEEQAPQPTGAEVASEAAAEIEGEGEPEAEVEGEVEVEVEDEPEPKLEVEGEPEPEGEAEVPLEPQAEAEVQPDAETEAEAEPEVEVEVEPESKLESEPDAEPEAPPEPAPEPDAGPDPEAGPQAGPDA